MTTIPKSNDALGIANRGNPAESGLCTLCQADCAGRCEVWYSCLKGRELLYPRDFGATTSGASNIAPEGVSYNSVRIMGYCYGAHDAPPSAEKGDALFTEVSVETSFGATKKTVCKAPYMAGALGSTFIAAKYWDAMAAGCAICGIPIVIGENVVGVDRKSEIKNGRIAVSPEMDRRLASYLKYYDGNGVAIVQLNVEDARNGVAEYIAERYRDKVMIELKWGQGAKNIGGEIQVKDIEYADFLKGRGYLVDPDCSKPEVREAFQNKAIHGFARHSRLGYTNLNNWEEVRKDFLNNVKHLRELGFERVSLKTGAYGMEALAMAIRLASEANLDLLTIDGAGGGTGMSPWDMMEHWGVPPVLLHAKAYEYASILAASGQKVVDMSFAGGFARSSAIFKGMALGSPFVKLICMGRALMIPGFLGSNIEGVLKPANKAKVNGNWDALPKTVSDQGSRAEEIFAGWYDVQDKIGPEAMKDLPFGAVAMWGMIDKLTAGLQQLMAGARKFTIGAIDRDDIAACNRDTERETGLAFVTDIGDEKARLILKQKF
ncbi:MAG: FMN-binding glutamate synthase family protein [Deltaproteobacteria bacterium]|jgi:glutamate synthase domain-containing protein 2|nr:FMN-binding glutamate synthase family protein [Deltaproteobacteria bacterium]